MTETLLVLNAGSSSIKFQLFETHPGDRLERKLKGQVEFVAPGSLPTDGKVIADERTYM